MEFPDAIRLVAAIVEQAVRDREYNVRELCPHTISKEHTIVDCANTLVIDLRKAVDGLGDDVTGVDVITAFVEFSYGG